jgi:hypothetical protein
MAVRVTIFLWLATPCELESRYQCFGETYSLHLQGECYKTLLSTTSLHGVATQKKNIALRKLKELFVE